MTVNFYAGEPDDDDGHHDVASCEICTPPGFDDEDCDVEDDEPFPEDLVVDFAFDLQHQQLACIYTGGLWRRGLPELYIRPPRGFTSAEAVADARTAVVLATALMYLARRLIEADGFEIPPYQADLDGTPVRFWLGGQEPPFDALAASLPAEVDTVIKVDCSLWHSG